MQRNPIVEWQDLTQLYAEMGDEELLDLDADLRDLTEVAQQVLSSEMQKRGLKRLPAPPTAPPKRRDVASPAAEAEARDSQSACLVLLCECNDWTEGWQLHVLLQDAGIESYIQNDASYYVKPETIRTPGSVRVMVEAAQIAGAIEVRDRSLPNLNGGQSQGANPEYKLPVCPACGAGDPVLEGVDPVNSWSCEACGARWTDSALDLQESANG